MKDVVSGLWAGMAVLLLSFAFAQDFSTELGAKTYGTCSSCHGPEGQGVPGAFPPHVGHIPHIIAKEGGRVYLIDTMLYGLSGDIQVLGETYSGAMPAWSSLSDEAVAAVLNHIMSAWGNAEALPEDVSPITADEVAAERGKALTPADVLEVRNSLGLADDE